MSLQRTDDLPKGSATTARAFADTIDAFPEGKFCQVDVHPALRDCLVDLSDTPVVETVGRERTTHGYRNVYRVHDEARAIADRTVNERDAICPCGHSGVRNRDGRFQCTFPACDETFDRAEVRGEREVRADGGRPPLLRFTGKCDCGRHVVTAVRRPKQVMCADPTARARCRGCGSTVVVRGDPPGEQRAMADGGTNPLATLADADDRVLQAVADAEGVDPDALDAADRERLDAMVDRLESLESRVSERAAQAARRVREHVREGDDGE